MQRRAVDAEAGRPGAPVKALSRTDPDPSSSSPQAPLSGFTAAISALQSPPSGPALGGGVPEPPDHPTGAGQASVLVVARRLPPDETGQLPTPQARLQRAIPTGQPTPPHGMGQRSLIAGRSPVPSPARTVSSASTTTAPAVQRLRYEDVASPSESRLSFDQPGGAGEVEIDAGEPDVAATAVSAAPSSAAWSPRPPATSLGGGGWSVSAGVGTSGSSRSGDPPAVVQRTAAGTTVQRTAIGASHPAADTATYPRIGEPPAALVGYPGASSPAVPSSDPPPMIQRRFDSSTPSTPVTPPPSADPPSMAVSGRSVGLAEMFAMAAAQSSAGDATVQRSPETEVQLTSLDSGPSESAPAGSAAPPPPASPARPPSGAELEEMARRLYEPLSARLRAELWQDRERSGLLTDLRP
ncbi:MAG TPA: hypothetical protein VIT65_01650 [Microlunatus sp.]